LQDAGATGEIERVYILAPDRLARRYAYQVLLIEEFRRAGASDRDRRDAALSRHEPHPAAPPHAKGKIIAH
jgi:hypothetical protein